MLYNANHRDSRELLAVSVIAKLNECGFEKVDRSGSTEAVYSRVVNGTDDKIKVLVYTSVVPSVHGFDIRGTGDDSIKVVAIYTGRGGKERGIVKETRVHRVGEVSAVVDRMLGRMRSVYRKAATGERCPKCGAPKFSSKQGNLVCADLCWLSDSEFSLPNPNSKRRGSRGYGRRWRRSA